MAKRGKLIDLLHEASEAEGAQSDDWLFLQDGSLQPDSAALLVSVDFDMIEDMEEFAANAGFPREGLQASDVKEIFAGVRGLTPKPSSDQLVRAFDYYLQFDAFLPALDAPDPPPANEALRALDRSFLESLGEEDEGRQCRREGCERGSVKFSAYCARHHFENVWHRPCPS